MNKHIIDPSTLTEEQIKAIKNEYEIAEANCRSENELLNDVGYGRATLLECLFGEELFEKGE